MSMSSVLRYMMLVGDSLERSPDSKDVLSLVRELVCLKHKIIRLHERISMLSLLTDGSDSRDKPKLYRLQLSVTEVGTEKFDDNSIQVLGCVCCLSPFLSFLLSVSNKHMPRNQPRRNE